MNRKALLVLCALVLGLAIIFLALKPDSYQRAAMEGVAWLMAYPEDYKNPGVYWALKESTKTCSNPGGFGKKLTERFESIPRSDVERAYFYFPDALLSEAEISESSTMRYDRWLFSALSCKERPISEDIRNELALAETTGGYDLTHAYLALQYLKRLECSEEDAPLDERIRRVENAMHDEERQAGAFNDLSAERAAFLLWGGRRDMVDDAWLMKIKTAQGPTGGWGDGADAAPNPHTTALAAWALAQASGRCPL